VPTWCPRVIGVEEAHRVVQHARSEVHVPERHRECRVAEELLDSLGRGAAR
jgi:hypothetical protein